MISGHPETKWGGSVMAALNIKNLPTGAGDDIKVDASWAKGDMKNILGTAAASPSIAMFGGSSAAFASMGIGQVSDAVYLPAGLAAGGSGLAGAGGTGDLKLTEGWGVRGAFNHNWDPYWSTSLFGGLAVVHYDGSATDITTAKGQWCASYIAANKITAGNSPNFSCNPDYAISTLGVDHPLDSGQEPDVLGRSRLVPSRPEDGWYCHSDAVGSDAGLDLRVQEPGHRLPAAPRSA